MAHVLINGMTESGKTTLARNLAGFYKHNRIGVLVLDPLLDPRWPCDFITDDQEEFLDVFWRSRRCIAFLDEGGESVGRYATAMQQTATRGRHWGHSCHYVCQRAVQLAPIVRDQCSHLFLFCSSARDGKILAEEFNKPELEACSNLSQGEYIHAVKFGRTQVHKARGNDDDSSIHSGGDRADNARSGAQPSEEGSEPAQLDGDAAQVGDAAEG